MTAWNLSCWAVILGPYIEGRLTSSGGPSIEDLDLRGLLNVTYSTLVDLISQGEPNGVAAIQRADKFLEEPPWPTEDEWLEGSEAQEGQAAMMEEFGLAEPARPREEVDP